MSIEPVQHHQLEATPAASPGSGYALIRETALAMADAAHIAQAIANTDMVPKHFRGKPDDLAAAILYGATLGFDPMQSARQVYVVHGQAGLYARSMAALVLSAGHQIWTVESTDESVTVAGQRKGAQHYEQATWTYERANKAGYTSNEKYRTDPQGMLYAKAASEVCRKIAPDVLNGVYAVEELQAEHWEADVVDVQRSSRTTPQRGLGAALSQTSPASASASPHSPQQGEQAGAGEPQPSNQDRPPEQEPAAADGEVMLDPRSKLGKHMFAAMNSAGITQKEDRLALCSDVTGREITSSAQLTEAEAHAVIREIVGDDVPAQGEIVEGGEA